MKTATDPIDLERCDLSRPLCAPALPCYVLTAVDTTLTSAAGERGVIGETTSLDEALRWAQEARSSGRWADVRIDVAGRLSWTSCGPAGPSPRPLIRPWMPRAATGWTRIPGTICSIACAASVGARGREIAWAA